MKLSRSSRCLAAAIALFCLLFSQLAVASYACPNLLGDTVQQVSATPMPGCTGMMDMGQPSLCQAHCDTGHQSLDTPDAPQVAPFLARELALVLPDIAAVEPAAPLHPDATLLARSTAPPLAIRHCCFRI